MVKQEKGKVEVLVLGLLACLVVVLATPLMGSLFGENQTKIVSVEENGEMQGVK